MVNDGWITIHDVKNNLVSLELVMMYQHGVVPILETPFDILNEKFLHVTINGQIIERQKMIDLINPNMDYYDEAVCEICKNQIHILRELKGILTTQYN